MKTLMFRPLRRIKKTGKIIVASYMQWRKVKTADYSKFNLIISNEHNTFNDSDLVYNHKGEQLFWHIKKPDDIPVLDVAHIIDFDECMEAQREFSQNIKGGYIIAHKDFTSFITGCLDCDGVPPFAYNTAEHIANGYNDLDRIAEFEPLTVGVVKTWFGWFLYQLKNASLQFT